MNFQWVHFGVGSSSSVMFHSFLLCSRHIYLHFKDSKEALPCDNRSKLQLDNGEILTYIPHFRRNVKLKSVISDI